ncbi:MAG: galactose mutarotase [Gemmatimonadota bacterium]|nr:galactose mutarotase [Gemmatimonadota bacterium]
MRASVGRAPFGRLPGGEEVEIFTLRNTHGVEARVIGYGGAIVSLRVPDRAGRFADVVLGYDGLAGYVADQAYFGALIGRHANRIREGRFTLDGREYVLPVNNGPNHLHGGPGGFNKVAWRAEPLDGAEGPGVVLTHTSPHGTEGYPGTLEVRVTYRLTEANELRVDYAASTDAPTPVNLTQHSYFNLTGDPRRQVLGHEVELAADHFTPVDDTLVPTGEITPVEGTPFDFRRPAPIGARIGVDHAQLARAGGYDHNFVLSGGAGEMRLAARVHEPTTGRVLELHTTEPGVQFYSGNFLDGTVRGKEGVYYGHRTGFCLEPQHFPDAPNQPAFPSTILRPGERYLSRMVYRFTAV